MPTVLAVFENSDRAVRAIETLRGAPLDTDKIRLVGGPDHIEELATTAGAGANLVAGPPGAVVDGLVESDLTQPELEAVRQRVAAGATLVLAEDMDDDSANTLAQRLREQQAENVIVHGQTHPTQ